MSIAVQGNGTQTCTVGVEHTLNTTTDAGTYIACWDLSNLQSGDTLEVRLKSKVLSTGILQTEFEDVFTDVQVEPNLVARSFPIMTDTPLTFSIKQTAGTSRDVDWKVLRF